MKRIIYLLAIFSCYFIVTSYSLGPATEGFELTGAENGGGAYTTTGCTCHSSSSTPTIGVALELDSAGTPTTHYTGGMTYTVKLTGTNNDTFLLPAFGFQMVSIVGSTPSPAPTNAGTWTPLSPSVTHYSAPQAPYYYAGVVEHSYILSSSGNGGNGATYNQAFSWKAPSTGTGTISIWAVLNAVNGDGHADTYDKWNTNHIVINEWPSSVGVQSIEPNTISMNVFPNPASTHLNLAYTLYETSYISLKLLDLKGRIVSNVLNETQNSGMKSIKFLLPQEIHEGIYLLITNVNGINYMNKVIIASR